MRTFEINRNTLNTVVHLIILILGVAFYFAPSIKNYVVMTDSEKLACQIIGFIIIVFILYRLLFIIFYNKNTNTNSKEFQSSEKSQNNYEEFIKSLCIEEFNEIIVMAHTGKNSLSVLRRELEKISKLKRNIEIKIILKHPYSETTNRLGLIKSHIKTFVDDISKIDGITVEVRYYNGLPYFHAILCKYNNSQEYYSYISYYKWENHKTKACEVGTVIDGNTSELFLTAKSWFEHLFSKEKLHTIIFDLDDTIIDSYDIQIKSWVFLIESIIDGHRGLGKLKSNLNHEITKENIGQKIQEIFLKTKKTEERWAYLFDILPNPEDIKNMEKIRFEKRTELTTKDAKLFDNAGSILKTLSENYNLAIISLTSENIIKEILDNHKLNSYFSLYLGKDNEIDKLKTVEDKTPYLIKISNLLGIPFNRMVFIGDSQIDFDSANQLNIKFIYANILTDRNNPKPSIIGHDGISFGSYNASLIQSVKDISKSI